MPKTKKKSKKTRTKRKSAPRISIADLLAMRRGPIQQGGIGSYPTSYWGTASQPIPIVPQGQDLQHQINALNNQLVAKINSQDDEYRRSVNLMSLMGSQLMDISFLEEEEREEIRAEKQQKEIEGKTFDISQALEKVKGKVGRPKGRMSDEKREAMIEKSAETRARNKAKKEAEAKGGGGGD